MRPLLAVFAHPDDEAFGPAGKIALEAKKRDVYLICVTRGDAGLNSTRSKKELSKIRKNELRASAKILGVKKVFFLDYEDGCLCNKVYHDIAEKINKIIKKTGANTLLTFEPRGISGHLDHITVSMICSYIFDKNEDIKTLFCSCINPRERKMAAKDYFIFFPEGYKRNEVDEILDISDVWSKKIGAMNAHRSQKHDFEKIKKILENHPKEELFLVKNK